jgi:hypothetical protein
MSLIGEVEKVAAGGFSTPRSTLAPKAGLGEGAESRLATEMELTGLEPVTSWVRSRRSPN